ncbi:MAG TPA: amidohydrolase family protein [Candidatus Limnocylindrales bacterium]|nr:amidohydrolase family protein [Candidatus Limnocylindrales bacterium]
MPLDMLVSGGRIATFAGDRGFGWVEAVGIRGGRVAFAGSAVDLETRADPHTLRVELEPGEIAIPGLTDAHLHLVDAAIAAEHVDLTDARTLDDGLAQLAEAHARLPEAAWLEGAGWDQRRWGRWPTAGDLDRVAPGRPAALWSFDHHALWASSAALAIGGVDAATPDPDGGIVRRLGDGSPEGVLLENACPLVMRHRPAPGPEAVRRLIGEMGRRLARLGVVAVHDPGTVSADDTLGAFDVYTALSDAGELPIRVHACLRSEGLELAAERGLRSGARLGSAPDGRATVGWLKLFADGTLGSQTAALLEPRAGSDDRGVFRMSPETLRDLSARAADAGIASQIHAIGDAAARAALDALEPTVGRVPLMPRLEHVQLVHPDDLGRFAAAGIAASVQPVHLREDAATARRDWGDRAEAWGYPWRSLLESGAVVAFGTDAPVEPIDPWPGIAMAVLRRSPGWGTAAPAFGPHEALTLEAALRAATVAPPVTAREPDRGRLVPGQRADLVVLPASPREPTEDAATGFATVRPRMVVIDGEIVYEDDL